MQNVGDSAALIRYRDQSGFAIISFKRYKQPTLVATPALLKAAVSERYGSRTLLLTSNPGATAHDDQWQVIDVSNPTEPASLVTIEGVTQRLETPDTGTLFFLGKNGLTILRRPSVEEEYQMEITYTN